MIFHELKPDRVKQKRGDQNDQHRTPAVEGVQKTHGSPLLIRRARLYDRADDHLGQTAADGIDHDGDADADIRIRCELRQDAEKHKSDGSKNMCQHGIDAVADPIREFRREQVHQNLCDKIDRHQKTDPGKGNPIGAGET